MAALHGAAAKAGAPPQIPDTRRELAELVKRKQELAVRKAGRAGGLGWAGPGRVGLGRGGWASSSEGRPGRAACSSRPASEAPSLSPFPPGRRRWPTWSGRSTPSRAATWRTRRCTATSSAAGTATSPTRRIPTARTIDGTESSKKRSASLASPQSPQLLRSVHWQEFKTSSLKNESQGAGRRVTLPQISTTRKMSPVRRKRKSWTAPFKVSSPRKPLLPPPRAAITVATKNGRTKTDTGLISS